jgi:hypothetical protein
MGLQKAPFMMQGLFADAIPLGVGNYAANVSQYCRIGLVCCGVRATARAAFALPFDLKRHTNVRHGLMEVCI